MLKPLHSIIFAILCVLLTLFAPQSALGSAGASPWENAPRDFSSVQIEEPEEIQLGEVRLHQVIVIIAVKTELGVTYYAYCHNDPINKVDVLGLAEKVVTNAYIEDSFYLQAKIQRGDASFNEHVGAIGKGIGGAIWGLFQSPSVIAHNVNEGRTKERERLRKLDAEGKGDPVAIIADRLIGDTWSYGLTAPAHLWSMVENYDQTWAGIKGIPSNVKHDTIRFYNEPTLSNGLDVAEDATMVFSLGKTVQTVAKKGTKSLPGMIESAGPQLQKINDSIPYYLRPIQITHVIDPKLGIPQKSRTKVLSSPNPIRKNIRLAYEDIKAGRGLPRLNPDGTQKIFEARELKRISGGNNRWAGSLEYEVPGTNHRILKRSDGVLGYVENHDYSRIKVFPAPWYPDGY